MLLIGPLMVRWLTSCICIGDRGLGMSLTLLMQPSLSGWLFSCMTHGAMNSLPVQTPRKRAQIAGLAMIRP